MVYSKNKARVQFLGCPFILISSLIYKKILVIWSARFLCITFASKSFTAFPFSFSGLHISKAALEKCGNWIVVFFLYLFYTQSHTCG